MIKTITRLPMTVVQLHNFINDILNITAPNTHVISDQINAFEQFPHTLPNTVMLDLPTDIKS